MVFNANNTLVVRRRTRPGSYMSRTARRPERRLSPEVDSAVTKHMSGRNVRADKPVAQQNPIIHWSTRNKSFLDVHEQLKSLGIRNNKFFLILLNPALEHVNPYDPNISPEMAIAVVEECRCNFFYYLREVARIPEQGGTTVPFRLDRGTLAAAWCFYNSANFYLMKPRQTGKSVANCVFLTWAFKFGATNSQFMISANTDKNVKELLGKFKRYIDLLPPYISKMGTTMLNVNTGRTERKTNNMKSYKEPRNGNEIFCARRGQTPEVAEEIGRGDSHVYELFDEAEFTPYLDIVVNVSGPAFNTASKNARNNGRGCCRMFSSTPGDLGDEKRGKRVMEIVNDCLVWSEKFYDEGITKVRALLESKTNYQIIYIEYSYQELGLGEDWFLEVCRDVGFNQAKICREVLLQRFTGNSRSPFKPEEITELVEIKKEPLWVDTIDTLNEVFFYVPKEEIKKTRIYFVGCDPSEGTGGDHYSFVVIDPYEMKVVAEFENAYMTPTGFIELMEYMVKKYFSRPIIAVERNRNGGTLLHFMMKSPILRRFIYHDPKATSGENLYREQLDEKGFVAEQIARSRYYGINTMTNTRQIMMKLLVDAMHFNKELLSTKLVCRDVCDLVEIRDKIQADKGKHDDSVMAWCIAMYTLHYGDELERFGFRKGELPDDILLDDEFKRLEELYRNPYIQQQFPSMYAYYMNEIREKKLDEAKRREEKAKRRIRKTSGGLGSIQKSISRKEKTEEETKSDVPYSLEQYQKEIAGQQSTTKKDQLISRWRSLNSVSSNGRSSHSRRIY